eukprot:3935917-Rhodomonas_salina.2
MQSPVLTKGMLLPGGSTAGSTGRLGVGGAEEDDEVGSYALATRCPVWNGVSVSGIGDTPCPVVTLAMLLPG